MPGAADGQATVGIRGVVSDAEGRPLASARVGLIDQESAVLHETQTDASGRFQFDGVGPTSKHRLVVTKFGYQTVTQDNVSVGHADLTITLRTLARRPSRVASPTPSDRAAEEPPAVELSAPLVWLNVSVKDAKGHPVPDLKKSNFLVYEEGIQQEITQFIEEDAPLSVALLLDTSGSMEGTELAEAQRAALEFIRQSHPSNEIALIAFNDQVNVVRAFTQDRSNLIPAIHQLTASGGTALYDAIIKAIELMPAARYSRHVIVLMSDGKDEDSTRKYSELERLVQSTDVVIFAIGEFTEAERKLFLTNNKYYKEPPLDVNLSPVWVLRQLSDISGGGAFFPRPAESLAPLFTRIAGELKHHYGLGYAPPPRSGAPRFRPIEVRVKDAAVSGPFTIRTRKGYFE